MSGLLGPKTEIPAVMQLQEVSMKKTLVGLTLCLAILVAIPALAGDLIIGNPPDSGTGNLFPWGSAYNAEYQQVYSASQFSGPIQITDLEFYNTQFPSDSTELPSGNWTITLAESTVNWDTISGNFASNLASSTNVMTVFSGNINQPWTFGETLTINLTTPYDYNPAGGNLLMDVVGTNISTPGGTTLFDVHSGTDFFTRVYCPNGDACSNGTVDTGYGLVTGFSYNSTPTPEPSSLLLLGSGLAGVAAFVGRRIRF